MKGSVLVYGAGVIGSVYALRCAAAGFRVAAVARGERLASLRRHGLALRNAPLGIEERAEIEVAEAPPIGESYDAIIVALRSGQVESGLMALRDAHAQGPVAVIGNNLGDLPHQASIVGSGRVAFGFGAFGGYRDDGGIVYLDGRDARHRGARSIGSTTLGIIDEGSRPALGRIEAVLETAGLPTSECPDIRAWLLYHAALVFPMAGAIYASGGTQERFCRTRDAVALGVRAAKELFRALESLGVPMQPRSLKRLAALPERLLVPLLSKRLGGESARIAMFGHVNAGGGRSEISGQAAVLDAFARGAGADMPAWTSLVPYFSADSAPEPLPDGSRELRLRWL
jgi:2-dehydropantoate 2-reductase